MTSHSVEAVGAPLLGRGTAGLMDTPFTGRLRIPDQPDVVLTGGSRPGITLSPAEPETRPDLLSDAAARVLMLWGRQPADSTRLRSEVEPEQLGSIRTRLSGY
jgi:hypothetical protein